MNKINLSQRIQLPQAFVDQVRRDCRRFGLSRPIAIGLAAQQNWTAFIRSLTTPPPLVMHDVDAGREQATTTKHRRAA